MTGVDAAYIDATTRGAVLKTDPEGAGLDVRQLERIDEHFISRYIEPGKIAGCQVAVTRHGSLGYFESFGLMDRERNRAVADDTIWRLYSMTKPIVGVALMQLYERGAFQLNGSCAPLDTRVERPQGSHEGGARRPRPADERARLPDAHDGSRVGDRAAADHGQVHAGDDLDPRRPRRHPRHDGEQPRRQTARIQPGHALAVRAVDRHLRRDWSS